MKNKIEEEKKSSVPGTLVKTHNDSYMKLIYIRDWERWEKNEIICPINKASIIQVMNFNNDFVICEVLEEDIPKADETEQKVKEIEKLQEGISGVLELCREKIDDGDNGHFYWLRELYEAKLETIQEALGILKR